MAGLKCRSQAVVGRVHDVACENGLLIESSGANRDVIKVLPPTITDDEVDHGIAILDHALKGASQWRGPWISVALTRGRLNGGCFFTSTWGDRPIKHLGVVSGSRRCVSSAAQMHFRPALRLLLCCSDATRNLPASSRCSACRHLSVNASRRDRRRISNQHKTQPSTTIGQRRQNLL